MNIVAIQTDVHTRMSIDLSSMWNIYKVGNIKSTPSIYTCMNLFITMMQMTNINHSKF